MLEQDILSSLTPDEVALLRREKSLVHLTKDPTGHFKDNKESMMRAVSYLKDGPHWQLSRKTYP